jgi:putative intracellular protease/amidase
VDGVGIDTYKMYDYRPLLDMVYNFYRNGKFVCAIGNGVKVVARANIIKNKKVSTPEDQAAKGLVLLFHGIPSTKPIEVQDNLCTIGDPSSLDTTLPQMLAYLGIK